jgi:hypothetical protein
MVADAQYLFDQPGVQNRALRCEYASNARDPQITTAGEYSCLKTAS